MSSWRQALVAVGLMAGPVISGFPSHAQTDDPVVPHENTHTANLSLVSFENLKVENVCNTGPLVRDGGKAKVAFLSGIRAYRSGVTELRGATGDVDKMYHLLTEAYGFPPENICVLKGSKASYAGFKASFESALINRDLKSDDAVVIFFAGHGSQLADIVGKDTNQIKDEIDGKDETLYLYDSETSTREADTDVPQLRDDEFNAMIARVYAKTTNITVLLDSCNSGSATRALDSPYTNRFVAPSDEELEEISRVGVGGRAARGSETGVMSLESMPDLVVFSASTDGQSALETGGSGLFTDAIINTLVNTDNPCVTYAELEIRVRGHLAKRSDQIPLLQGGSSKCVFSSERRAEPIFAWTVSDVKTGAIELKGLPVPGMGQGAELLVYSGSVSLEDSKDPGLAKARIRIDDYLDLTARAVLVETISGEPMSVGDVAVISKAADETRLMRVAIVGGDVENAVPGVFSSGLKQMIADDPALSAIMKFEATAADFKISMGTEGTSRFVQLADEAGKLRNSFSWAPDEDLNPNTVADAVADMAWALTNHLKQRSLLNDWTFDGQMLRKNETIKVRLLPYRKASDVCPGKFTWEKAEPNEIQSVPSDTCFQIEVTHHAPAGTKLKIVGAVMFPDGTMWRLPYQKTADPRSPERSDVFSSPCDGGDCDILNAAYFTPGFHRIFILGLKEGEQIPWALLQTPEPPSSRTRALTPEEIVQLAAERGTHTIFTFEVKN